VIPTIETKRLRLRPFEESDADGVAFYADADVMRYIPGGARDRSLLATRFRAQVANARDQWDQNGFGLWAVVLKQPETLIGHCGLQHLPGGEEIEVFYLLDKPYWNQGIATEATKAALTFGFERAGLQRIVAIAMPANVASQRVMQKAGMLLEGPAHHYGCDCIKYSAMRGPAVQGGQPR
jgi:ribosomal-protein-alanine N-acetyltransferase